MKNTFAICDICRQIEKACESLCSLCDAFDHVEDMNEDIAASYRDAQMDNLEHIQMFTLHLTGLLSEAHNIQEDVAEAEVKADSAFAEGELTSVMGEKVNDDMADQSSVTG